MLTQQYYYCYNYKTVSLRSEKDIKACLWRHNFKKSVSSISEKLWTLNLFFVEKQDTGQFG